VKGDYAKAIELYSTSISVTGGRYPAAEVRLASCLRKLKRYPEALGALERAFAIEPQNEAAFAEKAAIEVDLGNRDEAIRIYRGLLKFNSENPSVIFNLALLEMQRAHLTDAQLLFEKFVALDPKSERGWFHLSAVAEKTGDRIIALKAARYLVQLNPKNDDFKRRLQELEKKQGESHL
jgi:tetratricopeptide (TPR) repeat protein